MYDESIPTRGYMYWVAQFENWSVRLSHVDSITWRKGGEDSGRIDFGEATEKRST